MLGAVGKVLVWLTTFLFASGALYIVFFFGFVAVLGTLAKNFQIQSMYDPLPLVYMLSLVCALVLGGLVASKVVSVFIGKSSSAP
jgi:hypothetical protein